MLSLPFAHRRKTIATLISLFSLGLSPLALAAPGGHAPGRVIIEAKAGLADADLDKMLKAHGAGKRKKIGQSRMHVVTLPPGLSAEEAVAKLSRREELKFAELDRAVSVGMAVNDPYMGSSWHLSKIGAPQAWDTTLGAGVTIAILDSGVNSAHPDLKDRMVPGYNWQDNNSDTSDICGHGTAVAGAAAASVNNAIGGAGVAGSAKIMPVRIAYMDPAQGCYAYYSVIVSGLTYAADNGARVANVSFGGLAASASFKSAARYMKNKGGLVFISAGNSNIDENMAADNAFIAVSSTDSSDNRSGFSSWGNFVSLAAPGSGIWTTNNGLGYSSWNGTSFSSPVSAGVAGLVMSARPDLTSEQVESILFSSAVDLGAAGRDPVFGYGRVSASQAIEAAKSFQAPRDAIAPIASIASPMANSSVSGLVAVGVKASDNTGVAFVELKVNGTVVATDNEAPYSFSWNSAGSANGMASLSAVAYDAAGNAGVSPTVMVNVANGLPVVVKDTVAPVVSINNPLAGFVSGPVAVSVSSTDNAGAAGISSTLSIDGVVKAQGKGGSLSYNWNTRKATKGAHTIVATSRDAAGNSASTSVAVTVR